MVVDARPDVVVVPFRAPPRRKLSACPRLDRIVLEKNPRSTRSNFASPPYCILIVGNSGQVRGKRLTPRMPRISHGSFFHRRTHFPRARSICRALSLFESCSGNFDSSQHRPVLFLLIQNNSPPPSTLRDDYRGRLLACLYVRYSFD